MWKKFIGLYRVDDWFRNLGISLIGVLSAAPISMVDPLTAGFALVEMFLLQMHVFSLNDISDAERWDEHNAAFDLLSAGVSVRVLYLLGVAPLIAAVAMSVVAGSPALLAAAAVLGYLYQGRPRLKEHYATSILINAAGLGMILYIYPYVALGGVLDLRFAFFAILFLLYMAVFEIAHQVEHRERDKIVSIVDAIGVGGSVRTVLVLVLMTVTMGAIFSVLDPPNVLVYLGPVAFGAYRIYRLSMGSDDMLARMRQQWHKLYILHEGLFYIVVLLTT